MADDATISITATLLPDEISKSISGSMTVTPDDVNDKWHYKLTACTATSTDLIAGSFLDYTAVDDDTVPIVVAKEAEASSKAPDMFVSTVLILLCNALADAFKLCDTADGVAKLPLTDAAVAYPLPAVIVIEPSTERLLPSQLNLSPKLNFPPLSKKNGVFELPCVPVP